MRYFCPPAMRDAFRWQLLHISRGDRSIENYTRELFRLSRHAKHVMRDERRAVDLYVTGLGPVYGEVGEATYNAWYNLRPLFELRW